MGKPQRITTLKVPHDGTSLTKKVTVVGAMVIGDYIDSTGFRVLVFERPDPQPQPTSKPKPSKPRVRRTKAQIEADQRAAEAQRAAQVGGSSGA